MDKVRILESFPFYSEATEAFRAEAAAVAAPVRLEAGSPFYHEGDRCGGFALVGVGTIRVFKYGASGREITLYEVRDGETCLVDMLSTILDMPAPASAIARTDVEGLIVPAAVFRRWVREVDGVREHVFRSLSQRLVDLMTLVEQVAFQKADRRLAAFLLARCATPTPADGALEATHQEIAGQLGCAREAISRLLEDFERRGAVTLSRGRISLKDPDVLRGVAEDRV